MNAPFLLASGPPSSSIRYVASRPPNVWPVPPRRSWHSCHLLLLQRESIKRTSAANDDKLAAIQLICDRRISHSSNDCVPQRGSIAGAESHRISGDVAGEGQATVGCEDARGGRAIAEGVIPFDLAGLIIDRPQKCSTRNSVVGAGPAIFAMLRLEEIDSIAVLSADDEQA